MDSNLIAFAGIVLSALIGGAISLRTMRGQVTQTGADEFRGDLLTRIGQQDTKIERLEKKIDELTDDLGERDSHIVVLTSFIHAKGLQPPPWIDGRPG